jgi:hypothetical protein
MDCGRGAEACDQLRLNDGAFSGGLCGGWCVVRASRAEAIIEGDFDAQAILFTLAEWLEADQVDLAHFPRVLDHRRRMSERPGVRRAMAEELR